MFCCIGDLHLDAFNHLEQTMSNLDIEGLILSCLSKTISDTMEKGITDFVLLGDVFNTANPTQTSMYRFLEVLSKYPDATFYLLLGNHDFSSDGKHSLVVMKALTKLRVSNIQVIDKKTYRTLSGVRVFLCPHPYAEPPTKKVRWSLGHFAVNGAKSDNGYAIKTTNAPEGLWILGDFHTPQSGASKDCDFRYVGSLTQLSFQEGGKKRVLYVSDKKIKSIKVRQPYKLINMTVESNDELDALIADKAFSADKVFYRLVLKSGVTLPPSFKVNHPQVLRTTKAAIRKTAMTAAVLEEKAINPLDLLPSFLKTHHPEHADRALELWEKSQ